MIRTSRALAAAGVAALLLAGCGDEQPVPGAAAVVGEEEISVDTLREAVERGLEDPAAEQQFGADRADYQRQVLNRMVRGELLEEAAQRHDVEVTPGEVDEQLAQFAEQAGGREALEQQAAAGGVNPADLPDFAREVVLELELGDELTEDVDVPEEQLQQAYEQNLGQFDRVHTRHILVEDEARAREIAEQVRQDPSRFPELAAEFSTDESNKNEGGDLGFAGRGQFVEEFENAAFGAEEGEIVVVQTQFGWHVLEVLERQTTTLDEARTDLRRSLLAEQRAEAVGEVLREVAEDVGVRINPRFGEWSQELVEVVPVDSEVSSPAPEDGVEEEVPLQEAPLEQQAPVEPTE